MDLHFNTSHVNVNPVAVVTPILPCIISIHLMLMLIQMFTSKHQTRNYFNTSHVNVNLVYGDTDSVKG